MAGQPSDEILVDRAQKGDGQAFEALYQRYLPRVYNRLRALIPQEDVDDLTQDVFLAVVRSLTSFERSSTFVTWLYSITNHKISDYYRHRKKREGVERSFASQEVRLVVSDPSASAEDRALVRQVLRQLPERYRQVLLLRFAEDLSFKEIAQVMDLSLEATKSLYRRAVTAAQEEIVGSDKMAARR
jgi:RNA polymerase sigma-70 factor (ECF subfamily)